MAVWLRLLVLIGVGLTARAALAQACPPADAGLTSFRAAVNDIAKKGRAPSAANCAYRRIQSSTVGPEDLGTSAFVRFLEEAADINRMAASIRAKEGAKDAEDKYLDQEIDIRRRFLAAALDDKAPAGPALHEATVRNISALANALAFRQSFEEVDKVLSDTEAKYVDAAAVKVWLQALWSCAKFDGVAANPCTPQHRETCKAKVEVFFESLNSMKGKNFTPGTRRDINRLQEQIGPNGCFRKNA